MFHVQRDAEGRLIRVEAAPFAESSGQLDAEDQEIQSWFANQSVESSLLQLRQTDPEMIRVLEDLIHLLTTKGVLRITDLPAAAQHKLVHRSQAREGLGGLNRLIGDDDNSLI
ncbi:hypothetical protein SAMN05216296_0947 [Pseudomonas pohangensis]|jgi:hypothetical protein|uniref:Tryptophan synthase subunit beta n=1 Tax=Pseudomonas pohangensis TaxID=364197 RepID=A0A1H2ENQ9_9PSED|nr:tryptophan synthase subunit beta [Pseudomonas pohangensis]SDT96731.1 hypothetical protein SAMN05216296_0947 [Pseudomonas pohangensis]